MIRVILGYILVVAMVSLLLLPASGCATWGQSGINGCRTLCQGDKAMRFKDETSECVCQPHLADEEQQ